MSTLILNGTAKDLKLLLDISKKIGIDLKVVEEKTALNPQQEKFKKKFVKALQEAKDIRAGKKKAIPLQDFLDEL